MTDPESGISALIFPYIKSWFAIPHTLYKKNRLKVIKVCCTAYTMQFSFCKNIFIIYIDFTLQFPYPLFAKSTPPHKNHNTQAIEITISDQLSTT